MSEQAGDGFVKYLEAHQEQQKAVEAALAADREAALRDVFAAAALSALIGKLSDIDSIPVHAYRYADAMLAARKC